MLAILLRRSAHRIEKKCSARDELCDTNSTLALLSDPFCQEVAFEKQSGTKEKASGTTEFLGRETSEVSI